MAIVPPVAPGGLRRRVGADDSVVFGTCIGHDGGQYAPHVGEQHVPGGQAGGPLQLGGVAGFVALRAIFAIPYEQGRPGVPLVLVMLRAPPRGRRK